MDLFDILGPVMIGPSSSHTAGAARIGRVARRLFGRLPAEALIELSGSFAMTWQGHGIDRAILGGLMDFAVDDERLRNSRALADKAGLRYRFEADADGPRGSSVRHCGLDRRRKDPGHGDRRAGSRIFRRYADPDHPAPG